MVEAVQLPWPIQKMSVKVQGQESVSTMNDASRAMPIRRAVLRVLVVFVGAVLAGCPAMESDVKELPVSPEILRSSVRFQKEYILFAGDEIEVQVWRNPDVSRKVSIRPDGYISLPLLQNVKAAGLTPSELAKHVRTDYAKRLVNPEVTVIALTTRQPTVYVLGEVRAPGAFPLRNAVTAAQAIAAAGGTLHSSADGDVTVIRLSDQGYLEAIFVQSSSIASQPGPFLLLGATQLKADDIVFVPENGRSQVSRLLDQLLTPFQIYLNYKLIESLI
jgi:polysaccharide export outer membrane protein